jgi:ribosomal protein S1
MTVIEPSGWYEERRDRAVAAWPLVEERLPVGTVASGTVSATARFGVFVDLDEVPGAVALFDIVTWPRDCPLPPIGTRLKGRVVSVRPREDDHPGQVRLAPVD